MSREPRYQNAYRIEGDVAILTLTQDKEARISLVDLDRVLQLRWCAVWPNRKRGTGCFYAKADRVYLHRFIAEAIEGGSLSVPYVDHINGDGLDCRRENLRWTTHQQNADNKPFLDPRNTSGHRGVSQQKSADGRVYWIAKVSRTLYFPGTDEGFQQAVAEHARLYQVIHSVEPLAERGGAPQLGGWRRKRS